MAVALVKSAEIGAKEFGRDVDVAEIPKAKLMYYLDSICYALNLDRSERNIRKLRNYRRHYCLSQEEIDELLILCVLFSPDVLLNKVIFMEEEMCQNDMNKFYEVQAVSNRFIITEDILIGGQIRHVSKILCFRKIWIEYCYYEPIKHFQDRLNELRSRISNINNPRPQTASRHSTPRPAITSGSSQSAFQPSRPRSSQPPNVQPKQSSSSPASVPSPASSRGKSKSKCVIL